MRTSEESEPLNAENLWGVCDVKNKEGISGGKAL